MSITFPHSTQINNIVGFKGSKIGRWTFALNNLFCVKLIWRCCKVLFIHEGIFIHLFAVFRSLSTLYRSYHDGWFCVQGKPVHTVGQGFCTVNC